MSHSRIFFTARFGVSVVFASTAPVIGDVSFCFPTEPQHRHPAQTLHQAPSSFIFLLAYAFMRRFSGSYIGRSEATAG